jgi:hypothetical protein
MQPSSPDLLFLVPDPASLLAAIGSVALVLLGIQLAQKGYYIVRDLIRDARGEYTDSETGRTYVRDEAGFWYSRG